MLIPRSILKRNNPGGLIKDIRLQEATAEYLAYQEQQDQISKDSGAEEDEPISKYNALFGH